MREAMTHMDLSAGRAVARGWAMDPARAIERARLAGALAAAVEERQEGQALAHHLARRTDRPSVVLMRGASGWRLAGHERIGPERLGAIPRGLDPDAWLDAVAGSDEWVARDVIHGRRVVGRGAVLGDAACADELTLAAEVAAPFFAAREPAAPPVDGAGLRAAELVHDLRQPLGTLLISLQLLEERVDPPGQIARCRRVLARMSAMIDELLARGAPERRGATDVPLGPLVVAVAADHRERARRAEVVLEVEIIAAATVRGDASTLERALGNVVENAIEVSPRGGVVKVTLATDGDCARIRVGDQGPGVPVALRERVFDPFFTTRPGGNGLGLAMARTALRQHDGSIRFVDGPGGQVELRLPLHGRRAKRLERRRALPIASLGTP
jgi:signal transduction histidine kinase